MVGPVGGAADVRSGAHAQHGGIPLAQASDVEATVQALLEAAGIPASDEELAKFVEMYPALREGADRLYGDEWRTEEPALSFTPVRPTPPAPSHSDASGQRARTSG